MSQIPHLITIFLVIYIGLYRTVVFTIWPNKNNWWHYSAEYEKNTNSWRSNMLHNVLVSLQCGVICIHVEWMILTKVTNNNKKWNKFTTNSWQPELKMGKNKCRYGSFAFLPFVPLSQCYFGHWSMQTSATICLNPRKWPASIPVWLFREKKCWYAFQAAKEVLVCHTGPPLFHFKPWWQWAKAMGIMCHVGVILMLGHNCLYDEQRWCSAHYSYSAPFKHYYSAEYEYTIWPTIQTA